MAKLKTSPGGRPRATGDEEDVALGAFDSFCRRAQAGQFPHIESPDDLWKILFVITARKSVNFIRADLRDKRRPGKVLSDADVFAEVMGREPTPELAAQVAEQCRRLLDSLGDAELQAIAVAKMEGYTNVEIAEKQGCSRATIERKLRLIRKLWQRAGEA